MPTIRMVRAMELEKIDLAPATLEEEITQNICLILNTARHSEPLNRGGGLPLEFLDRGPGAAQATMIVEIAGAIDREEPRAKALSVHFEEAGGGQGRLAAIVEVEING